MPKLPNYLFTVSVLCTDMVLTFSLFHHFMFSLYIQTIMTPNYFHMPRIVFLILFLVVVGCNNHKQLGGKVTFEDGTPVPIGAVIFETDTFQSVGTIQSDGTYQMSSLGQDDGLPPGEYRVRLSGTGYIDENDNWIDLVDLKFLSSQTSQ